MSIHHSLRRIGLSAILILIVASGLLWFVKSGFRSTATRPASAQSSPAQEKANVRANNGEDTPTPAIPAAGSKTNDSVSSADPSGNPAAQPLLPVASGGDASRKISTRSVAAQGQTIAQILKDADMSDPEIRARKVAEMRLLEERQHDAVITKANQLGIPLRIDGPDHKISILYDILGNEPLYRTTLNANAAISTGADLLASAPYNLDGTGVKVGIWDGGPVRSTHVELTGRVTKKDSTATGDDHATHVAGTIGATGIQSAAKGMAPKVNIDSYEWTNDYDEMTAAGAAAAGESTRIPISNHSYGYGVTDMIPYMGTYQDEANAVDAVAASLPYYMPFWAAGNEQDTLTSLGGFQSITFTAIAKNIMTIGAVNDAVSGGPRLPSAGTIAYFSSLGPCDDGRIKPDVVANGMSLYSSIATSNSNYASYNGTSMATPNAVGSSALLAELYAREFSGQRMRASMMKALLIQTADDIGTAGPDYTYGWGLINVKAASDVILANKASLAAPKMIEGTITNAAKTKTHTFTWDGVSPIRATVCWTDPTGTIQPSNSRIANLVHNLDAKITAPNATTTYSPYVMPFVGTWTQSSMSSPATTGKNKVDNVEQVYLASPTQAGTYTITVSLDGTLTTASQVYSLIITGGVSILSNPPPDVALTSPADGSAFLPGVPVTVSATATDMTVGNAPGEVTQVEFFSGTTSIGMDTTAPYSVSWLPPASGTHVITAKATDNEAAVSTSTVATITVLTGDGTPVISSFSPASGAVGVLAILTGSNFAGVSSVKFNGVEAAYTADSAGQITATVPALATSGTLSVTNLYGTGTSTTSFTVLLPPVLISQIYGAGGNSGASRKQDYVELYNRSTSAVSLAGWSVQYAASAGTTWQAAPLSGSLAPGKYYLVGLATGTSGSALPTPDAGNALIAMSATKGKVALMNTATILTVSSPVGMAGLQDFVGCGASNAYEGSPAPSPSTTTAIFRAGSGATDTANNADDFTAAAPNPRNMASGPPATPVITSATNATGTVGTAFIYQITASNSPASFTATGLPDGLTVTTTGAITGTPTAVGTYGVTISATNIAGTGSATLALTINPAGGGGGTTHLLSEDFTALNTDGDTAVSGTGSPGTTELTSFNPNFPTTVKLFPAGGKAKLGSASVVGAITSKTLDLSGNGGAFKVSFKVKGWTTVEGGIKVTVTGLPVQTVTYASTISGTYETKVLSFTGGTTNSTVKFETTAKRAFLDDILVYYSSAPAPAITAAGPLAAVNTTYGTASASPANFTVSGANMTEGILVTSPGGFEVSLAAGSGYAPTLTIPGTGTIASTPVFLRLAATTTAGSYSGVVTCSSAGASPATVPVVTSDVFLKLLTITADNQTKAPATTLVLGPGQTTFTSIGLVGSESIGSVTLTATGTAANDTAGLYPITPSAATGGTFDPNNYSFNYLNGTLTVTSPSYSDWVAGYPVGAFSTVNDDPDHDGLPNGIENILGTTPDAATTGLTQVSATGNSLVFHHSRSNTPAADLTASYEWSGDLIHWHPSATTAGGTTVTITAVTINDTAAPANDLIEVTATVTATVTGSQEPQLFVRLKAVR